MINGIRKGPGSHLRHHTTRGGSLLQETGPTCRPIGSYHNVIYTLSSFWKRNDYAEPPLMRNSSLPFQRRGGRSQSFSYVLDLDIKWS
ncbi:uncharacterized protein [Palaemon carinicauda]